jgi:hypothetical protein
MIIAPYLKQLKELNKKLEVQCIILRKNGASPLAEIYIFASTLESYANFLI